VIWASANPTQLRAINCWCEKEGELKIRFWGEEKRSEAMRRNHSNSGNYRNPCLTMHQPWASLLVYGIKRVEGRSWPAPITGFSFLCLMLLLYQTNKQTKTSLTTCTCPMFWFCFLRSSLDSCCQQSPRGVYNQSNGILLQGDLCTQWHHWYPISSALPCF